MKLSTVFFNTNSPWINKKMPLRRCRFQHLVNLKVSLLLLITVIFDIFVH